MGVEWTQLPPELVEAISKRFHIYADYLRFRAVCHSWRSSLPRTPAHLPPQLPWLMLPHSNLRRAFFNPAISKFHFLNLPETSPPKRCRGSSQGWLVLLAEAPDVLLLNPLTRVRSLLPPLTAFPNVVDFNFANVGREYVLRDPFGELYSRDLRQMRDSFIKKVVLSSSPMKEKGFVALAILNHSGDLAYSRIGDNSWTIIEDAHSFCEDVVYHDGLFFAVEKCGIVAVCDLRGGVPRVSIINTPRMFGGDLQYLVSSNDELLLVTRYLDVVNGDHLVYRTMRFEVFRLELQGPRWEQINNLGDMMLFLGENSSLSLSASDFSGSTGNCIYYTDDYSEFNYDGAYGEHDLGVFKLWDGSIEPLPCYSPNSQSGLRWPSPLWISPSPC